MKKTLTVGALLAVIAVCGVVLIQNLKPIEDDGYVPPWQRAVIKKFDRDGDGKLNREEQRAADAAIKASGDQKREWIKRFDRDGDGELNREEREAAAKASSADREAIVRKFDLDGDGKLNEEEGQAARKALGR